MRGRFISYLRVSTNKQGADGLGIEAQRKAVADYLNCGSWELIGEFVEVESGKSSERPQLAAALATCKKHKARLVIAKLDRLSRSVAFTATLMERGVDFVCCDNPHATPLTIHILAAMAEHERKQVGKRTSEAMAAAKAKGVVLGNAALAAANKAAGIERAKALAPIFAGLKGKPTREIARILNERKVDTPSGAPWSAMTVNRVRKRLAAV
ncbi:MAG TPA: recombinase family protein [Bradyrhizobium sp.]